jgi:hypothetical protein
MAGYWISLAVILILTVAPLVSVLVASTIAEQNGCRLDEGGIYPCMVGGSDIGETLATMAVMGWLMLASFPFGAVALAIWLIVLLVHKSRWDRRQFAELGPRP